MNIPEKSQATLYTEDRDELTELADLSGRKVADLYRECCAGLIREMLTKARENPAPGAARFGDPDLETVAIVAKKLRTSEKRINRLIADGLLKEELRDPPKLRGFHRDVPVRLVRLSEVRAALAVDKKPAERSNQRGFLFGGAKWA